MFNTYAFANIPLTILLLCIGLCGCKKLGLSKKTVTSTWKCKGACSLVFYRTIIPNTAPQRVDTTITIETEVTISKTGDSSLSISWQMYGPRDPITYESYTQGPFILQSKDLGTGRASYQYKEYRSMVTDEGNLLYDGENSITFSYVYASPSTTERVDLSGSR